MTEGHAHTCRRCGSSIDCDLPGCDAIGPTDLPVWEGDNVGCPNELAEYRDRSNEQRASKLTDTQLATIVATFRSSAPNTANAYWRDACAREQEYRAALPILPASRS